jgi:hypothetical protein
MNIRFKFFLVGIAALLHAAILSAAPPSGTVTITVDTPSAAIYDLNGGFTISQSGTSHTGAANDFSVGLPLTQDGAGRLHGKGTTILNVGSDAVAADFTASGHIFGGGGSPTRVVLQVRLHGNDVIAGVSTPFLAHFNYSLVVSNDSGTLEGRVRGNFSAPKLGNQSFNSPVSIPLPNPSGAWTLQANIAALSRLAGTGSVILSTGRTLPGKISGSYSAIFDQARIHFTGVNEGRGTSFTMSFVTTDTTGTMNRVRGTASGQRLHE